MLERTQLNQIQVATPCKADWASMKGDDAVRFCGQCNLNVYNLSAMSLKEVETLISKKEGRTCVRFFRRTDGTVITDDCPVGLRAVRRRLMMVATACAGLLTAATAGFFVARCAMGRTLRSSGLARLPVISRIADWLDAGAPRLIQPTLMGRIAVRPLPVVQPLPTVKPSPLGCKSSSVRQPVIRTSRPSPRPEAIMGDYAPAPVQASPSPDPVATMGAPMPFTPEQPSVQQPVAPETSEILGELAPEPRETKGETIDPRLDAPTEKMGKMVMPTLPSPDAPKAR